jgi:hypothetical protein
MTAPRVGGHRHQHPQPLDHSLDAIRIEHIGAKLHRPVPQMNFLLRIANLLNFLIKG